jgi:hypothetical protein
MFPTELFWSNAIDFNNNGQVNAVGVSEEVVPEVSEPETYALMLAGLGLIGLMARGTDAKNRGGPQACL